MEWVLNFQKGMDYVVCFMVFEFMLFCLLMVVLDFVYIVIDYVLGDWLVESKFLKFFFGFFCNYGVFYEDCFVIIGKCIEELLELKWLCVGVYWYLCGGILIDVFY